MRTAAARPSDMRRTEGSAVVSAATMSSSTAMSSSAPTMPAAAAGICFEREKRHDEEQYRGYASAGR